MNETSKRKPFRVGFLLFANMTQLDATGPAQVLSRMSRAEIHFASKTLAAVATDCGLSLVPTTTFANCPDLDLVCVPGGAGITEVMEDDETLGWLRTVGQRSQYVTSVCTGSLILAAAGLLQGYKAACHWASYDNLARFGVEVVSERVVVDRNRITGGGVTAGIDFGFHVIELLRGRDEAEAVRLILEYDPQPLGAGGTPETARPEIVQAVKRAILSHGGAARSAELDGIASRRVISKAP